MMVFQCDRCKALGGAPESVRGKDLCAKCIAEFDAWVESGPARFKPSESRLGRHNPRNPAESSLTVARAVADKDGKVSARAFAAATGEDFRASYQRLRHLHRKGLLERVAGSVYRLPAQIAEAAE